ncbi:hypothetical protein [Hymenobacter negativus]|uniref:Outer membrane protein beta-barrel domain-containing protein n=1 Tax=Hymenobacter negativus TaxID=2795026 RepID=A0ABS3QH17_9BACT|nr:hypothetical protein [Hymenobacter negativus]MBO2010543.1 hypothetical protein [Hymenobacter negativus]
MWSDNDIDKAFQRLNPPEPEPTPFPLDAWLRLETELDKAVIERAVRRRLWKFFAAEVAIVAILLLGWLAWPTATAHLAESPSKPTSGANARAVDNTSLTQQRVTDQSVTIGAAKDAAAAQPNTQTTANKAASTVSPAPSAGASGLESAPYSSTAIAAAPTVNHAASTPEMPFAGTTGLTLNRRRRNAAESGLAFHGAVLPAGRLIKGRRSTAARSEHTRNRQHRNAPGISVAAVAQQGFGSGPVLAKNTDQHPAAGSIAVPTGAPAEAVVADAAAPGQLRREGQSPLLDQTAVLPEAIANEGTKADAPDALAGSSSATAVAALVPITSRMPLAIPAGLPSPLAPIAVVPADLPAPVRQPRFYIGLVAAPDLTTVKFVDVERPKLNIGVVLEYRLTNRLRVSTGLLRANKQYVARREDYDWGAYPKAATRNFTWVDGACTVLDVPLNLRYDAVVRPQARLFGSVGLSSFFMQRERYMYDYTEYNTPYVWDRTYVNENQHLFSVLNLSFGYEHRLGTHWSLQAEPYLKVPLAGVGVGKVQLTSGGVFFGAKYGF